MDSSAIFTPKLYFPAFLLSVPGLSTTFAEDHAVDCGFLMLQSAVVGMRLDCFATIRASLAILRRLHDGHAAALQIAVEPAELLKMLIPVWFHPPYVSYWCNKATVQ